MNNEAEIDNLEAALWEATGLGHGPAKIAVLEALIRRADTQQCMDIGFDARMALVETGTFAGAPDKALVAFSWCLSQADRDPENYPEEDLLWKYKWIVHSLGRFPQVSKQQIDGMLADLRMRYMRNGAGEHPVVTLRWKMAMRMGDQEACEAHYSALSKMPRDGLSDCAACIADERVHYRIFLGQDAEAIAEAEAILAGRLRCAEVPHVTFGRLLLPLLKMQRLEEAAQMHRKGYLLAAKSDGLIDTIAEHLLFLGLTANLPRAAKIFAKHFPAVLESNDPLDRFEFFRAARFVMECLASAATSTIRARLPRSFALYQEKGRYDVAELNAWLTAETDDLACRFDERNGNDYFKRRLQELKDLHGLAAPYPLT
jgi:hypothetical protein